MGTSQMQRDMSDALSIHFGGLTIRENVRPSWLIDDDGERLELDFYLPEIKAAIEVQGAQHYVYVPHFHGNYSGFLKQQRRDEIKRQTCQKKNIRLIEVFDTLSRRECLVTIRLLIVRSKKRPVSVKKLRPYQQYPFRNHRDMRYLFIMQQGYLPKTASREKERRKRQRARTLLSLESLGHGRYRVSRGEKEHLVTLMGSTFSCDCKGRQGMPEIYCSHIIKVLMHLRETDPIGSFLLFFRILPRPVRLPFVTRETRAKMLDWFGLQNSKAVQPTSA